VCVCILIYIYIYVCVCLCMWYWISLYKILFRLKGLLCESIILVLPPSTCKAYPIATILHDHCSIYALPSTFLRMPYTIHSIVMAISCKGRFLKADYRTSRYATRLISHRGVIHMYTVCICVYTYICINYFYSYLYSWGPTIARCAPSNQSCFWSMNDLCICMYIFIYMFIYIYVIYI